MIRLGIMGGTFNPIHNGHLMSARIASKALKLDEVLFLPDGEPPHKAAQTLASGIDRYNMTALAIWGHEGFTCSDMEILRAGTTYTIDTLAELTRARPEAELFYIVGADALFQIENWWQPEEIARYCRLIAIPRPDSEEDAAALKQQADHLQKTLGFEVFIASESGPAVSSTELRSCAVRGGNLGEYVPQPVADYIAQHGIYDAPLHQMTCQLSRTLSPHRLSHTLSVAQTAVTLAARFGENPCQAHLAGMLHDCAKGLDAPVLLQLIRSGGISADDVELSMPALLHAPAGAALAREQYHVNDAAVLSAIRWHTTGRKNMTKLEKIIYLADMIEPERADFPGLSEIRALAREDLNKAVAMAAARSAAYVLERGKKLHPRTMELANTTQLSERTGV
ncbi:MAG: nicotinate-nucleotide adenylyltransferase [Clostridia bacterium]|nr:nicotinate-nucleotide adenylyltransferase [Clostridia bacterium]